MEIQKNIDFSCFKSSYDTNFDSKEIESYLEYMIPKTGLKKEYLLQDIAFIYEKIKERKNYKHEKKILEKSLTEKLNWNDFYQSLNESAKKFLNSCIKVGKEDSEKIKKQLDVDSDVYQTIRLNFYREIKAYFSVIDANDEKIVSGVLSLYKKFKNNQTPKEKNE